MSAETQYPHVTKSVQYWKTRHALCEARLKRLEESHSELLTALRSCLFVMKRDLDGLKCIQPEIREAELAIERWGAKP